MRTVVVLALVAAFALATGASGASPTTVRIADVAGDANAVNGQFDEVPFGNVSGPVQRPDADVLSVTFAPTRAAGRCTGFTVAIELAAPAAENTIYRVLSSPAKFSNFWLEYDASVLGTRTVIYVSDPETAKTTVIAPARLVGNTIVITVTAKDLETAGEHLSGFGMYRLGMDVRSSAREVTAPRWDNIDSDETKSFTPCG
jgi:hypothetical protein